MPFTFSHPAIILPLKKWFPQRFSMTGLVAGSVVPDFEFFLKLDGGQGIAHTYQGILFFNLPMAIFLSFVFHGFVKKDLIESLPVFLQQRCVSLKDFSWKTQFRSKPVLVLASMIVGISSHIFWDDFTHLNGYFVGEISWLQKESLGMPHCFYNQMISSVVGLIIVIVYILRLPKVALKNVFHFNLKYWLFAVLSSVFLLGIGYLMGRDYSYWGTIVITSISGFFVGMLLYSAFQRA